MGQSIVEAPFTCMDCGKRQPSAGDCGACGKGPLVDARDPEVVSTLREDDDRRKRKREGTLIGLSVLLGVGGWYGASFVSDFAARLIVWNCLMGVVVCGVTSAALWALFRKLLPFRKRFDV